MTRRERSADEQAGAGSRVTLAVRDGIAFITLDRPERLNALTLGILERLDEVIAEVERDADVRAVVVSGAGNRGFSAGADVLEWGALAAEDPLAMWRRWDRTGHRVLDRLETLPVPVIAAVHGLVLGGGLELALAADLRVASDDTTVGLPEVTIGASPGWGGARRLAALVGVGRAKELVLIGEPILASTALAWGLVNEVTTQDALLPRATALATRIAANAPIAVQLAKAALNAATGSGASLAVEGLAGALGACTTDGREGPAAFRAKRRPVWTGR